jgi:hypothetical protein
VSLAIPSAEGPLMTADEAAAALRLSRAMVYQLKDRIGYVQLGRVIRFEPFRVRAFIAAHRQGEPGRIAAIDVRSL